MRVRPDSINLRQALAPVYHQSSLASCAANAVAGALSADLPFEPSRLFLHYNSREAPPLLRNCVAAAAVHGACPEADWPYEPWREAARPPDDAYARAWPCRAEPLPRDLAALQDCLAEGRPFVCALMLHYRFITGPVRRSGVIPLPRDSEPRLGGHAVAVVGYDDARQWFIVRNSMGLEWGDQGYGYLPYRYLTDPDYAADFWSLRTVPESHQKGPFR